MATAFAADGSVDLDQTAAIAVHLVDNGHDGLVVSGTTGESPTTTVAECGDILRVVRDAVGSRAKVVAGVGTNVTTHSVELVRQAEKFGADGALLVTPYYSKPSQAGLLHHFTEVAAASDLPVMLYDVPGRTGTTIAVDTYAAAKELPNVVAIKDAVGKSHPADAFAAEFKQLAAAVGDTPAAKGDNVTLLHVPGAGLRVRMADKVDVTVKSEDFARAVWGVYLGPRPIDEVMKRGLVGRLSP